MKTLRLRASARGVGSSLLVLAAGGALAQSQERPEHKGDAASATPRETRLENRRSGTGRDQFIAPVMGIQIDGEGLSLPPGVNEDEPPVRPAAEAEKPRETKPAEPRSIPR